MMTDSKLKKTSCRKLIEAVIQEMGLTNIGVVFDSPAFVRENLLQTGFAVFLSVIDSPVIRKQYQHAIDEAKKNYRTQFAAIHFPDLNVFDFLDMFKHGGLGIYSSIIETVRSINMKGTCNLDIRCVLFMFLHEAGHWQQLDRLSVPEYIRLDEEISNQNAIAVMEICNRVMQNNAGKKKITIPPQDKQKLKRLHREYREIPKEKEADEFAKGKMQELDIDKIMQKIP